MLFLDENIIDKSDVDYYDVLRVNHNATEDQIRRAYRALVREYHPYSGQDPDIAALIAEVQEAYRVLIDPERRHRYDRLREADWADGPSPLKLRSAISPRVLTTNVKEQICYALLEVSAAAEAVIPRLPLNLCLVLDRSSSMRGIRLHQVKEGTRQVIQRLDPEDSLSLVVFSDRPELILPAQKNLDKARASSIASTIQAGGGTEMVLGLEAGLRELDKQRRPDSINHLILLTDGQTYGDEAECLEKAEWAGRHQIGLTTMGIGEDWNESLLDQMAGLSGGASLYIDSPLTIGDTFKATLRNLSNIVVRNLTLGVEALNGLTLTDAFQVAPQIQRLDLGSDHIALGSLSGTPHRGKTILMEFKVSSEATPAKKRLMRLIVYGELAGHQTMEWVELFGEFVSKIEARPEIPQPVMTVLRKLAIFKMHEKVLSDLAQGQNGAAAERLEIMATRLLNLGETDLARVALAEAQHLARSGELTGAGRKKIRYGVRALSVLPKEVKPD